MYQSSNEYKVRVQTVPLEVQLIWTLPEKPDTLKFYPDGTTNAGFRWEICGEELKFLN